MTGKTHSTLGALTIVGISMIATTVEYDLFGYSVNAAFMAPFAMAGALLPDIDHAGSKVGSKLKWISKLFKHRGFTHSLVATVIIFISAIALSGVLPALASPLIGFAIGYASHLAADFFNPGGIQLLWPSKSKVHMPILNVKTGGIGENILLVLSIVAVISYGAWKVVYK